MCAKYWSINYLGHVFTKDLVGLFQEVTARARSIERNVLWTAVATTRPAPGSRPVVIAQVDAIKDDRAG
jgi:hypothetical protein